MVLQARYKAEEVGYAVVGEKEKELPNVIDYNIKPEITKDASSVVNANNDTTTGMADVIPGVNAPKLIADTSIIGGGLKVSLAPATQSIGQSEKLVNTYTLTSNSGDVYINSDHPGWIFTNGGTYAISITIKTTNSNASVTGAFYEYATPNSLSEKVLNISQSGGSSGVNSYVTIRTAQSGVHYRLYLKCGGSMDYAVYITVTFVKLA